MADRPQGASEHTTGASSEAVRAPSTGRAKVVRATLWTVMGHGGAQFVRLVRNLILTRLLAPDLFGLMLIANTVRVGLEMFSDTGVGVAIVRDKRGHGSGVRQYCVDNSGHQGIRAMGLLLPAGDAGQCVL